MRCRTRLGSTLSRRSGLALGACSPSRASVWGARRSTHPFVAAKGAAAPTGPVHLNSATLEQLDALPGVGPVTAQKIIDYRTQHGGFGSVDELDAVSGIGPARLADLRSAVAP